LVSVWSCQEGCWEKREVPIGNEIWRIPSNSFVSAVLRYHTWKPSYNFTKVSNKNKE